MLNNITFIKGRGGLGRSLPGEDYISGMIFYDNTLPSGFSPNDRIKQIFSVEDAENLGISGKYSDETKATVTITITATGSTGDQLVITTKEGGDNGSKMVSGGTLTDAIYQTVTLATYIRPSTDTTTNAIATGVAQTINLNTDVHGYTASATSSSVTVTAKSGLGTFPNGKSLTITPSGTIAATSGTYSGGVASKHAVKHYHISEYFRIQPQGNLWVGIFPIPTGAYDFNEISLVSAASEGKIRQVGIYQDGQAFNPGDLNSIQTVCNAIDTRIANLSVLLASDFSSVTNLSTLIDLSTYQANKASVVLAQDAGNIGNQLAWGNSKSITALGAALGAVSKAKVSEDIAWVSKFNMSSNLELESIGFANGVPYTDASISTNLLNVIDLKRYIFLRKIINFAGSYFNDSHTAVAQSSDYAYIENNRTIDKAIRGVYADLIPNLNGPLELNSDGTLSDTTLAYLESQASISVNQMVRNAEISAVSVKIDSTQNVAATSTVIVTITIVPIGVMRNIVVNIGFAASI